MPATVFEWIGGGLVLTGSLAMIVGALGLLRMPDVFTRLHATSVSDTFGVGLVLIGLAFYGGLTLVTAKLVFLFLFLFLAGPVSSHAIARAAMLAGLKPVDERGKPIAPPGSGRAKPSKR